MEEVWEELRYRLTQTPVLRYSDFNKPFIFYIDVNKKGIRAVLCQKDENIWVDYVVQYYSRILVEEQRNWFTIDLKYLTIIEAV